VFEELRTRFCTPESASTVPTAADLERLPQPVRDRVMNADGTVNPERWAEFRGQMCSGNFVAGGGDPARFAQLREQFCGRPGETPPPITDEQLAALPPQMLERLKGPDGKVDPERVNQLRTQFCSSNAPSGQQGGQQGQGAAGPQGGPVIIMGGPGGPGGNRGPGGPGGPGGGPRGPGGGGGFMTGGGSPDGRGRFFVNFNYTYEIENEVLVAPGGPLLDQLDGQALSGSLPRHQLNFSGGLFYAGFGTNVNARYSSSSFVEGSGLPGSTELFYSDIFTVGFRVFADLNQRTGLIEDVPLLKNTRLTFGVNNLFDTRQSIVDSAGDVPLRFQPYLIDPTGRFFEIELRKLF
jgi:hypothetical protein